MKKLFLQSAFTLCGLTSLAQLPELEWATTIENNGENNYTFAVATDAAGNVYQAGTFSDTADFDPGPEQLKFAAKGYGDCFVSKTNPDGILQWVKTYGGINPDYANTLAFDASGNIFISGTIQSTPFDFDPGVDSFMVTIQQSSGYVLKLDADGNFVDVFVVKLIQPSQPIMPTAQAFCSTVHIDNFSNIYIGGTFRGDIDLDPGPGELVTASSTVNDDDWAAFIIKLNPAGNFVRASLIKAHVASFAPVATPIAIRSDNSGNIVVAGDFRGTMDFNPGAGVAGLSSFLSPTGSDIQEDVFLLKLDSAGTFTWVKQIGGQGYDYLRSFETDNSDDIIIGGFFDGIADFDPGAAQHTLQSEFSNVSSSYFAKYDFNGTLLWAKNITYGKSFALTLDVNDNIFLTGTFSNTVDMDFSPNEYLITETGSAGMFVAKYNSDAGIIWAVPFSGSANYNLIWAIKTDLSGNVYAGGYFGFTADFDPGEEEFLLTATADEQSFLFKLGPAPLAINELISDNGISVFPNPVNNYCSISLQNSGGKTVTLEVFNSIGAIVFSQTINSDEFNINTSAFLPGVYFARITDGFKTEVVRLIK